MKNCLTKKDASIRHLMRRGELKFQSSALSLTRCLEERLCLHRAYMQTKLSCCAVLSYVSSQGKGSLITTDAAEGKAKEKASRGQGGILN